MTLPEIEAAWKKIDREHMPSRLKMREALLAELVALGVDRPGYDLINKLTDKRERELLSFSYLTLLVQVSLQRARIAMVSLPHMNQWLKLAAMFQICLKSRNSDGGKSDLVRWWTIAGQLRDQQLAARDHFMVHGLVGV